MRLGALKPWDGSSSKATVSPAPSRDFPGLGHLGEAKGAFLLCGSIMCGPSGLFTEEFDAEQRQLRGNLPHAFLLESAAQLGETRPTHG